MADKRLRSYRRRLGKRRRQHKHLARVDRFVRGRIHRLGVAIARRKRQLARLHGGPRAAIAWADAQVRAGVKEHPPGSNWGHPVMDWIRRIGFRGPIPWCGAFVGMALLHAGVKVTSRVASVAAVEDDAKAGRNGFRAWSGPGGGNAGDVAILFGRGVHEEIIRRRVAGGYETDGGNTSYPGGGSQSNGGCCARRVRPYSVVRGIAHPRYP